MNPNDYDNDGNNIVPCPICLSNYNPCKDGGKCPEEDMFALEGEIRLLLDEYKATDDNSRIANVLEAVEKLLTTHEQAVLSACHERLVERVEGNRKHVIQWGNTTDEMKNRMLERFDAHNNSIDQTITIINSVFKKE